MSTIFGVLAINDQKLAPSWGNEMMSACELWPADLSKTSMGTSWMVGCCHQFNTPQAPLAEQPIYSSDGQIVLVYDGRLDNRPELATILRMQDTECVTDEDLILNAYQRFGHDMGQHLLGDFALAIMNVETNTLFLIRDHLGVRPLFIARNNNFVAFASNKKALLALPWVDCSINKTWVADLLEVCKVEVEPTLYNGIETFPAAHCQSSSCTGSNRKKYWELKIEGNNPQLSDDEYVDAFKRLLQESVACRLRSYTEIGSELSGGLDSTTIVSIAATLLGPMGKKVHAYSHVMPPEDLNKVFPFMDESVQMAEVCKLHPEIIHHKIYSKGLGILDALCLLYTSPSPRDS